MKLDESIYDVEYGIACCGFVIIKIDGVKE
jgi:hypothetical protein